MSSLHRPAPSRRTERKTTTFFFFLHLEAAPRTLTPRKFNTILQIDQIAEMNSLEMRKFTFLSLLVTFFFALLLLSWFYAPSKWIWLFWNRLFWNRLFFLPYQKDRTHPKTRFDTRVLAELIQSTKSNFTIMAMFRLPSGVNASPGVPAQNGELLSHSWLPDRQPCLLYYAL